MNQGVRLTCYDIEQINIEDAKNKDQAKKKNLTFGYQYGHRFDYEGHSWVFLRDYISLAYSYMTFVIKKKFDEAEVDYTSEDFLFDLEQYNYLIGGKTALTETKQATADHDRLQYILQNFKEIDPVLLEQIQYYHIEREYFSGRRSKGGSFAGGASLNESVASADRQGSQGPGELSAAQSGSALSASRVGEQGFIPLSELREAEKKS
jgi:hypothetical protein